VDLFDAADYADVLPRRWKRRLVVLVAGIAIVFPGPFQRWYIAQAQHHAEQITRQITSVVMPKPAGPQPTENPSTHAPRSER
jgi:hypothetical protein